MRRAVAGILAVLVAAACSGGGGPSTGEAPRGDGPTTTAPAPRPAAADLCAHARPVPDPGMVANPALVEASGLVASVAQPGVLWSHNDSGGAPEVFALGPDGTDRGRWAVAGAHAVDWEDIARGRRSGHEVLYLGDIGDNLGVRPTVTVYRAPEPTVPAGAAGGTIAGAEALVLRYADGPHNAEALLADPVTGDLFIVTKTGDGAAGTYRIPADAAPGAPVTIARAATVDVPAGQLVTGGDVAADGSVVVLRTYLSVLVWDRAEGRSVAQALAGRPCEAPVPAELQGEAVALDPDGRGYATVSEGAHPAVNRFRLP